MVTRRAVVIARAEAHFVRRQPDAADGDRGGSRVPEPTSVSLRDIIDALGFQSDERRGTVRGVALSGGSTLTGSAGAPGLAILRALGPALAA